ncbi:MarR family transcriptional regulator [soil metagenome]
MTAAADAAPSPFLPNYLPYLLQRADDLMSRRFHRHLQAAGIGVSEWRVLAVLHDDGPCPLSVLADATMLPQPTTTHAVARLERRGLVARRTGVGDRRQRIVALTETGEAAAQRLITDAGEHERLVLAQLGAEDVETLRRRVHALVDQLHAGR